MKNEKLKTNFRLDDEQTADFRKHKVGFHGDVFFVAEPLPEGFDKMAQIDNGVVALGEATGHNHRIFDGAGKHNFDLREATNGDKYLSTTNAVIIRHQEHKPTIIPAGTYKIGIQREYDPFSKRIRKVVD